MSEFFADESLQIRRELLHAHQKNDSSMEYGWLAHSRADLQMVAGVIQ